MKTQVDNFLDYFQNKEEYPSAIAAQLLPVGTLWEYISVSFLNGLINYVEPIQAFVIGRYRPWTKEQQSEGSPEWRDNSILATELQIMDPPNSYQWKTVIAKDKNEAFNLLTEPGRIVHLDLGKFDDDVLILARVKDQDLKNSEKMYYYFWFDCDVSDCCIGRFITTDPEDLIKQKFAAHVANFDDNEFGAKEIPLHAIKGWLKF